MPERTDRPGHTPAVRLSPQAFEPALGKRAIDRELKSLRDAVGEHPRLTFLKEESQTIGGLGRADRFSYLSALDRASVDMDIAPFTTLVAERVRWSLEHSRCGAARCVVGS